MTRDKKPPVSEKPVLFPIPTGWKPSGSLDHPVSCLLLDVYGTLFISGSGDIHSFAKDAARQEPLNALLHRYGISDSANALVQRLSEAVERAHVRLKDNGIDFPEIQIEALWRQLLPEMNNHCLKTFAAEFERITNPVFPMPHLGEMLQGMKQNGVLLGIISNAQFYTPRLFEEFLGASLEDLGFSEELILFSYVFGRAKPSFFL
ncbi:MAG: HAD family hydrolase, partial [Deltaproteobacteria bacterium]|nr:HAD family hydrolase [Deltaproteobacteria bacterium]